MGFHFFDLDATTRSFMAGEVDRDTAQSALYMSPRLAERGRRDWPGLLRAAVQGGDEQGLADSLRGTGRLREFETRRGRHGCGSVHEVRVPSTAAATLAGGEFNRFYIRGLCLKAADLGIAEVMVYRAKAVVEPRPGSASLIGALLPVARLLDDLRTHSGEDEPAFKVPGGPNSGLSVRIPNVVVYSYN